MGESKDCLGFHHEKFQSLKNWKRHAYGSSLIRPKGRQLGKRTVGLMVIVILATLGHGTKAMQGADIVYRRGVTSTNDTEVTTVTNWKASEDVTNNKTELGETTISWMQFMEEDAVDLNNVAKHVRLRRAADDEGSGSGVPTDSMTTSDVTTISFTEPTTEPTITDITTEGSGFDQTTTAASSTEGTTTGSAITNVPTTGFTEGDMTTEGSGMDQTATSTAYEDTTTGGTVAFTTESHTTQALETSNPVTMTTTPVGDVTGTTEEGSGMEFTTDADTTVPDYTSTEAMTVTRATESFTTSASSGVSEQSTNSFTETTEVGSGMEETSPSITVSTEASTSAEEQTAQSTTETATQTTAADVCAACVETEFCATVDGVEQCVCKPDYYDNGDGNGCVPAKLFGGILHFDLIFVEDLNNTTSAFYQEQVKASTDFLITCYGGESWFVGVKILGFRSGSTLVEHQIIADGSSDVDSTTVEKTFTNFISNDAYYTNCSCGNTNCSANPSSPLELQAPILANESCQDAGTQTDLLCEPSSNAGQYCSTGTECAATLDGNITCDCTENLVPDTERTCIVPAICSSGFGCNQPFGTCDQTLGSCICMWGFQGTNCEIIWVFVLVLCIAGLVLIAIIVAIAWWCRRRRSRSKKYESNPYSNAGAMSVSLDRFQSMSEWDEKIGGVVPTSYKRIGDDEYVENPYERGDFDQHSDSPGMTLRDWRVTELGSGDRKSNGSHEYVERPVHLSTFQDSPSDSVVAQETKM